jgi:hypothetical protein
LLRCAQTLASVKRAPLDPRNIHKISRRNDLYPARAAIACWVAVSDSRIDRNRKAIGTDLATSGALTRQGWLAGRQADGGASSARPRGRGLVADSMTSAQNDICAELGTRTGRRRLGENSPTESRKRDLICPSVRQDILRGCSAGEVFDFF